MSEDQVFLEECINQETSGHFREVTLKLQRSISEIEALPSLIPVSAMNNEGLSELYGEISRVLSGGEDFSESY